MMRQIFADVFKLCFETVCHRYSLHVAAHQLEAYAGIRRQRWRAMVAKTRNRQKLIRSRLHIIHFLFRAKRLLVFSLYLVKTFPFFTNRSTYTIVNPAVNLPRSQYISRGSPVKVQVLVDLLVHAAVCEFTFLRLHVYALAGNSQEDIELMQIHDPPSSVCARVSVADERQVVLSPIQRPKSLRTCKTHLQRLAVSRSRVPIQPQA
jgi:hypothetical protein